MTIADENKDLCRRYFDVVWNNGEIDRAGEFCADDMIVNNPDFPGQQGIEGVRKLASALRQAFPDLRYDILDMIAEGDRVAIRLRSVGTHSGRAFGGMGPTNQAGEVTGIAIARVEHGKIAETWAEWNFPRPAPGQPGLLDQEFVSQGLQ